MGRLAHYARRLDEVIQERRLHIDSGEQHVQLDSSRPEFRGYAPTAFRDWRIIRRHITPDRGSAFIDYGAGLGRVSILAAELAFGRVIGVELDPELVTRARANVQRAKSALRAPVDILCADATAFEIPADASTLFFCNPFTGSVLSAVLERARASYRARPRKLAIVCNLPEESAFEAEIFTIPFLQLEQQIALCDGRKCLIFNAASEA